MAGWTFDGCIHSLLCSTVCLEPLAWINGTLNKVCFFLLYDFMVSTLLSLGFHDSCLVSFPCFVTIVVLGVRLWMRLICEMSFCGEILVGSFTFGSFAVLRV